MEIDDILMLDVIDELPFEEIEAAILQDILQPRRPVRNRGNQFGRFNLDILSEEEILVNFRFARNDLPILRESLGLPDVITTPQRYKVSGLEGLCILLRRLAYPNRLVDLEPLFGLSAEYLSVIANSVMGIIYENKGHLLNNLQNLNWLNDDKIITYAQAVVNKGGPIENCWGFIDGTARAICRPTHNQEDYFSGHKRMHCLKYQSILCPDGIVVSLLGAFVGRRHDAGIFRETNIYQQLRNKARLQTGQQYVIYGDQAYPISDVLIRPYSNRNLTPEQQNFNHRMSLCRQAVEWGFGKIISDFAFLDFKKNQKLLLQDVETMYQVGMILTNCHTCLYGSQTSKYFNIETPNLQEYLE